MGNEPQSCPGCTSENAPHFAKCDKAPEPSKRTFDPSEVTKAAPTPEPREPAARESAAELLLQYPDIDEYYATDKPITRATAIEFALAYAAELRARVKELETADIQRAKDITRLTIERDQADEIAEEEMKLKKASERSLLQARAWVARLWELGEFTGACGSALGEDGELAEILRLASTSAPSSEATK